jgi:hypothetical protein
MHELVDDVAGIISSEENDDVRNVLWLSEPPRGHPPCSPLPGYPEAASLSGHHGGSPYPFLSDLSSLD